MGAPSVQGALHPATEVIACKPSHIRARSFAGMTVQVDYSHAQTVAWIAPDGGLHRPAVGPRPGPVRQGQVLPMHCPLGDHAHERIHSGPILGNHHQATGVLVKAVHDARAGHPLRLFIARKKPVQQRSTPVSRGGMNDQARRLVNYQQVLVFVNHIDGQRLRAKCLALQRRAHLDRDRVAGLHPHSRLGGRTTVQ